jgi:DNA-binding response OmpR family regulator
MKLLVVDDDKDITDMVKFYCESKGLDCTVFNNGNDGLEVIRKNNESDLILLDLVMPEVSGLHVFESLKKENLLEARNIVIFTASTDPIVMAEIRNSGVKGILQKPCSLDELGVLIEKFRTND